MLVDFEYVKKCEYIVIYTHVLSLSHQLEYLVDKLNEAGHSTAFVYWMDPGLKKDAAAVAKMQQELLVKVSSPLVFLNTEQLMSLTWIKACFAVEGSRTHYCYLPSSIVRFVFPHGIDIVSHRTIHLNAAHSLVDYVLTMADIDGSQPPICLDNLHRIRDQNSIAVVPCGYPKLDQFIHKYLAVPKKNAIIYHIAHFDFEHPDALKNIIPTLRLLLDEFPDKKIIFRPMLSVDQDKPLIKEVIELFKNKNNFYLSTKASYVDDYCEGFCMITHREYASTMTYLATGMPNIVYVPYDNSLIKLHERGSFYAFASPEGKIYLHDPVELIATIKNIVLPDPSLLAAQQRCQRYGIYHPGESMDRLIEALPDLLAYRPVPNQIAYAASKDFKYLVDYVKSRFVSQILDFNLTRYLVKHYNAPQAYYISALLITTSSDFKKVQLPAKIINVLLEELMLAHQQGSALLQTKVAALLAQNTQYLQQYIDTFPEQLSIDKLDAFDSILCDVELPAVSQTEGYRLYDIDSGRQIIPNDIIIFGVKGLFYETVLTLAANQGINIIGTAEMGMGGHDNARQKVSLTLDQLKQYPQVPIVAATLNSFHYVYDRLRKEHRLLSPILYISDRDLGLDRLLQELALLELE